MTGNVGRGSLATLSATRGVVDLPSSAPQLHEQMILASFLAQRWSGLDACD
jgi:hypothetical protein